MGTHLENRIRINGLDSLRSRPGVRFAPSGLHTVLDERCVVARMEPAGRANARPVGAIRGARIDGGCIQTQRATEGIENPDQWLGFVEKPSRSALRSVRATHCA